MRTNTLHPQIEVLLDAIDLAFDHRAWHGPNLRGSIRGVTSREAAWRPGSGRHNIWELVVHAAYWKYAARRRLRGDRRGAFPLPGSNWFERPAAADEKQWRADVALLEQEHHQLRVAVQSFSHSRLKKGADHEQYDSTQHGHYGFGIAWISHRADDGLGTRHRRPVAKHYRNPGSITANHFRRQHHSLHRIVREDARRSPGIDAPARG